MEVAAGVVECWIEYPDGSLAPAVAPDALPVSGDLVDFGGYRLRVVSVRHLADERSPRVHVELPEPQEGP